MVETVGAVKAFTVRNGTISSSGADSIPINTDSASGTVVEDLTIIQADPNTGGGVSFGSSVIVRRVSYPGGTIRVYCPALVVDSLAYSFQRNTDFSSACTLGFVT